MPAFAVSDAALELRIATALSEVVAALERGRATAVFVVAAAAVAFAAASADFSAAAPFAAENCCHPGVLKDLGHPASD